MTLLHLTGDEMRELLEGHEIHTLTADDTSLTVSCEASEDNANHLEVITKAALAFLHGDDWSPEDLARLAKVLGVPREDVEALSIEPQTAFHAARPGANDEHCAVCGQNIQSLPDGDGDVYVHIDSGSVTGPNPPRRH